MKIIEILLPIACDFTFTYIVREDIADTDIEIGSYILVPFRNSQIIGVAWKAVSHANQNHKYNYNLKEIAQVIAISPMHQALIETIKSVAYYNMIPKGMVLKMTMPEQINNVLNQTHNTFINHTASRNVNLTAEQNSVYQELHKKIEGETFSVTLLDGNEGKIMTYCAIISSILKSGNGQILIMIPEILLATQISQQVEQHLGITPIEWNSYLTPKKKNTTWIQIKSGETQLIIGTRSALLLPYNNLKLIIVTEEHESSHKQDQQGSYNARDMAIFRAQKEHIPVFLVSSTPSLETMRNISLGKFTHFTIQSTDNLKPNIEIIDMRNRNLRKSNRWISDKLITSIEEGLAQDKIAMLFANHRGYNPYTICNECKYQLKCINCSTHLIWYAGKQHWSCRYCNYRIDKTTCPKCSDELVTFGVGAELIAEEVQVIFPDAKIATVTHDTKPAQTKEIINNINSGEINIIIATQMIAKCINNININPVGIIDADIGPLHSDLRAFEKTYQLLCQITSKTSACKGSVIIQTRCPYNIVMKSLKSLDRDAFYKYELEAREKLFMPPFSRLVILTFTDKDHIKARNNAHQAVMQAPQEDKVAILGPVSAPLFMVQGKYRYKVMMKASKDFAIQSYISKWQKLSKMKAKIDIDPVNFV